MSSSSSSLSLRGDGWFLGALALLFIGLKLCHVIGWSWWFVTMPLWIVPAASVTLIVVLLVTFLPVAAIASIMRARAKE